MSNCETHDEEIAEIYRQNREEQRRRDANMWALFFLVILLMGSGGYAASTSTGSAISAVVWGVCGLYISAIVVVLLAMVFVVVMDFAIKHIWKVAVIGIVALVGVSISDYYEYKARHPEQTQSATPSNIKDPWERYADQQSKSQATYPKPVEAPKPVEKIVAPKPKPVANAKRTIIAAMDGKDIFKRDGYWHKILYTDTDGTNKEGVGYVDDEGIGHIATADMLMVRMRDHANEPCYAIKPCDTETSSAWNAKPDED